MTAMPLVMPPVLIDREKIHGWEEFGPEDYCHECGTRNIWSWSVDSSLWNQITEESGWDRDAILCPQCFTEAYFVVTGNRTTWRLSPDTP